jgi:two-component system chemotaxis sensor kinase CheA
MDDFELELKQGFLEEASQGITDVEQCFLDLENDPSNIETINKIFRLAHNLKGSSRAVGFDHMGEFTHAFESFILKIKNKEMSVNQSVISMLLKANDHLKMMVDTYTQNTNAVIDSSALIGELANFQSEDEVSSYKEPELQTLKSQENSENERFNDNDGLKLENVNTEFIALGDQSNATELITATQNETLSNQADLSAKERPPGVIAVQDQSIRVSLNKVEQLINFVGEMVILQSVLNEQLSHIDSSLIRRSIAQLGKVSKEIQDISMSLRMVPVRPTFQKMQRIVRDTAKVLEKDIAIHLEGEETELDKTILERITDPLVHLVRNAVDHGVESPDQRVAIGKPAKGNIRLSAYHKSGRLIIEIQDDGAGLNPDKLKKKAIEKGIIKPDQKLSDAECYQLIFAPGFSTKEQVTDISGRGVGMDVVRTNISDIGGEISITSELGKGTTFTISLPLTLAIIDAMVVSYSNQRFVIPLNHVYETLRLEKRNVTQTTELGDVLTLRGEPMPVYRLGDFFGLVPKKNSGLEMIVMVNRSAQKPFALLVDDIIGQSQVVIKQLTPELSQIKGVSGVTILGDGRPAFIVEPTELIKRKLIKNKPLFSEAS